jgi:hypothetical protein
MRSGIVKVIPPKEWYVYVFQSQCCQLDGTVFNTPLPTRTDSLPSVSEPLKGTRIREPISQHFMGSSGLYRQTNVAKYRMYNPKQWKEMCDSDRFKAPNFFDKEGERERERENNERRRSARSRMKQEREVSEQPAATAATEPSGEASAAGSPPTAVLPIDTAPSPAPSSADGASPSKEKAKPKKLTPRERAMVTDEEWATFDWTTLDYGKEYHCLSLIAGCL